MENKVPEKFQNEDGTLNAQALLKSYAELEKKIGGMITVPADDSDSETRAKFMRSIGVPESADEYSIPALFEGEESIKERFLEIGLSKPQAEAVARMAEEILSPAIGQIFAATHEKESMDELEKFFGGLDKMTAAMAEINSYAEKHFSEDTIDALCSNVDGIKTIYNMMQASEPVVQTGASGKTSVTEADLRQMMKDPRYWRDNDVEYIRKIESGFRRLYG